jgi:L-ribulose-5-phosphate 3-epimerase
MYLGYNTNGLAHHDPFDAVELLAEIGYRGVALTLDHGPLNPFAPGFRDHLSRMRQLLQRHQMRSVVETGARYLLDPRRKHEPTLVSPAADARDRRVDFLKRAVGAARELASDCVSLWSGIVHDGASRDVAFDRLLAGLGQTLDYADDCDVSVGFEPEPGMFIGDMTAFDELRRRLEHPRLRLTLDVGHLQCQGELPLADYVRRYAAPLVNVHLEDMRRGVHEHLMFGDGEIEFPPVLAALTDSGYTGGIYVELSRHSYLGPQAARQAFEFLSRC